MVRSDEHGEDTWPVATKDMVDAPAAKLGDDASDLAPYFAVYLENPDGSLSLGLPPNMRLPSPPSSPRARPQADLPFFADLADPIGGLGARSARRVSPAAFAQHERLFTGLLVVELTLETAYLALMLHSSRHSVHEVAAVYQALPLQSLWTIFWAQLGFQLAYLKLYFGMGFSAANKHKPRLYAWFSNVALTGIVVQVLFAYMNKANIVIFALRLFCYVYSRFMKGLLHQLAQYPPMELDV
mmetsp:Transcript_6095/g.11154  ORF Transcript_6095/g.11154 Transcript_6095/m.11154 type:complete len:241 (-) Transcript_6095:61-783(-)